jgi:hypothetical protein
MSDGIHVSDDRLAWCGWPQGEALILTEQGAQQARCCNRLTCKLTGESIPPLSAAVPAGESRESKGWSAMMAQVHPCGHTEAQHQYYAEKTLNLDISNCPAAPRAEVEKLRKALNSIKCEVVGWLSLARPMLVQELSVTNVRVMEHHVAEAERLLAVERKE